VVDAARNTVTATFLTGTPYPVDLAVSPDGKTLYVSSGVSRFSIPEVVSVIDTTTDTVTTTIPVGTSPTGVGVTPDGSPNTDDNTVSVIDTKTNTVIATIPVGNTPEAFGIFIEPERKPPPPQFAGTPGKANCHGKSVSALARQYGGLNAAAAALGYSDVSALQNAIMAFLRRLALASASALPAAGIQYLVFPAAAARPI
jgi:YVTN family beta-propeller protein